MSKETKETGGQAFPRQQWEYDGQNNVLQYQEDGMTMRDYLAAKAMQGMLSNPGMWDLINENHAQYVARDAYLVADAMLKARNS
ncbi:hypothetical protein [Serratia grimesii]|uniref:hypothetical protein n=1 Tax=Serratia grimesii TaxID=82995 RepID=UPI0021799802|nr:hypothetical protein [Serratia grimesii]CAI1092920.1 Uncharacterised protein [Serratia grimesii]